MKHSKLFIPLITALFILMSISNLFPQGNYGGGAGARGGELSLESYADQLTSLSSQSDPFFNEAYRLIDMQLPTNLIYDRRNSGFSAQANLYQQAEQRYFRFQYVLGHISARYTLMYETREQLKKLRAEYVRNNPIPYSSDTRSTMSDQVILRSGQIRQKIAAYDAAIRFASNLYAAQLNRSRELVESSNAKKLTGFVLVYNQNVLRKTEPQIRTDILYQGLNENNRGERDAGGISNNEYRARNFALNILLPIFDSTKGTKPAESLPSALAKILSAFSKTNP